MTDNKPKSRSEYLAETKEWWDEFRQDHKVLIHYIRNKPRYHFLKYEDPEKSISGLYEKKLCKGPARGVVIAWKRKDGTDNVSTGWAFTHTSDGWGNTLDTFDRLVGIRKAVERTRKEESGLIPPACQLTEHDARCAHLAHVPRAVLDVLGSSKWVERGRKFFGKAVLVN